MFISLLGFLGQTRNCRNGFDLKSQAQRDKKRGKRILAGNLPHVTFPRAERVSRRRRHYPLTKGEREKKKRIEI